MDLHRRLMQNKYKMCRYSVMTTNPARAKIDSSCRQEVALEKKLDEKNESD